MFKRSLSKPTSSPRRSTLQIETLEDRLLMASNLTGALALPQPTNVTTSQSRFTEFDVRDAAGDGTENRVLKGGALKVDFDIDVAAATSVKAVHIEAWRNGWIKTATLKTFKELDQADDVIVPLSGVTWELDPGMYTIKAKAELDDGSTIHGGFLFENIRVVSGDIVSSFFRQHYRGETFYTQTMSGDAIQVRGGGGTDTLKFDVYPYQVESINGMGYYQFDPMAGGQAIHQGQAVDYIRLDDGREIYFTGIERLEFRSLWRPTEVVPLAVEANDPYFNRQWNLHVTDVPSAWRFTRGSDNVLLVSLDTGVISYRTPKDLDSERLITFEDIEDPDQLHAWPSGHQHYGLHRR